MVLLCLQDKKGHTDGDILLNGITISKGTKGNEGRVHFKGCCMSKQKKEYILYIP